MHGLLFLFVMALMLCTIHGNPNITKVTCKAGPEYTFTTEGQTDDGVIFVSGVCASKTTATTIFEYTFADGDCGGSAPALGSEMKVVVQEIEDINLGSDFIAIINCSLDTDPVIKEVSADTAGGDAETIDATVKPTFAIQMVGRGTTAPVASGEIGMPVDIKLEMDADYQNTFMFQIEKLEVQTSSASTDVISNGCTDAKYKDVVFPQPGPPTATDMTFSFKLFLPSNTSGATPVVQGKTAITVTYTFTIQVCVPDQCVALCTSRRRRSVDQTNSTIETVQYATSVTIYPPGQRRVTNQPKTNTDTNTNVCLAQASFYALAVSLLAALAVCIGISACMCYRLKNKPGYMDKDASYKNKAFSY
ncbi:uncharacterized protein LOC123533905 [Mercenaria mercenaria]|uniref:uncharacterized protein LOC123533905 n=1 Tax=Mercenaria mercenaria TaxID=6596 RepID=UPI001E1DB432|nr:uncharacterized protein LOC123533905 [Mercenaria mercenaria]